MPETATPQPVCHPLSCRCAECACIRLEERNAERWVIGGLARTVALSWLVTRQREGVRIVACEPAHPGPNAQQSRADDLDASRVAISG